MEEVVISHIWGHRFLKMSDQQNPIPSDLASNSIIRAGEIFLEYKLAYKDHKGSIVSNVFLWESERFLRDELKHPSLIDEYWQAVIAADFSENQWEATPERPDRPCQLIAEQKPGSAGKNLTYKPEGKRQRKSSVFFACRPLILTLKKSFGEEVTRHRPVEQMIKFVGSENGKKYTRENSSLLRSINRLLASSPYQHQMNNGNYLFLA